jgi:ABC-2 type transport system permease protein
MEARENMYIIFRKEVSAYFSTPFGFIFMGIFLLFSGIIFTTYNLVGGGGDLNGMFGLFSNISFMIFPVLTIKMFADERRNGTESILLTSRLTSAQIVLGKYFAACFLFLVTLAVTGVYVVILKIYGFPYMSAIVGSYIGFFLLGAAFISVCTFTASLADNPITAAVSSFGALVGLVMAGAFSRTLEIPVLSQLLSALALTRQYDEFIRGIFRPGPVVYFIAFSAVFLCLSVVSIGRRRFV